MRPPTLVFTLGATLAVAGAVPSTASPMMQDDPEENAVTSGFAQEKSHYTLFNPTPRELRRPMSADRPDLTESPYTVDAGAVQLEMSFFDYAKNGSVDAWSIAPINLKLGLNNDIDVQFVLDPYTTVRDHSGPDADGFGDVQIRVKYNLWGNDGGENAFAVMPFIKIPTAADGLGNDHVEGGIILPFSTDLAEGVGLGLMAEIDFVYDEVDDSHDVEFVHTAVLGFDLTDQIGWYLEGVGIATSDSDHDYRALVGTGLTFAATDDLIFDTGVNIGLSGDADDVNVFAGMTLRF